MIAVADRCVSERRPGRHPRTDAENGRLDRPDTVDDVVARIGISIDEGSRAIEANVGSVGLRAVAGYADGGLLLVNGGTT